MAHVTLFDLFRDLDGKHFKTRQELEVAVLEVFNEHVAELPVGYSYKDAIEGARAEGWLHTNGGSHGVTVSIASAVAGAG